MIKRPIDSFVNYFLEVKPYHTKILEIIESYRIKENVNVSIAERIFFREEWRNELLCKGIGFGLDFDDDCGFSVLSCCDLFDCVGGYGLIFDNSDILQSASITNTDNVNGSITVSGDRRYDTYFQIHSTVGNNNIRLLGNHVARLAPHALFVVTAENIYPVMETVSDGFYVSGNVTRQFVSAAEFRVVRSPDNDGIYHVTETKYIPDEQRTFVKIFKPNADTVENSDTISLAINSLGDIIVDSSTKNNGAYQRTDVHFDGIYTNIILHPDTLLKLTEEIQHGSLVLRTGFIPGRKIWLVPTILPLDPLLLDEVKIIDIEYHSDTNESVILLDIASSPTATQTDLSLIGGVELRGYYFGAGFDNTRECSTPKPYHIYATFSEFLSITVIEAPAPAPSSLNWAVLLEEET